MDSALPLALLVLLVIRLLGNAQRARAAPMGNTPRVAVRGLAIPFARLGRCAARLPLSLRLAPRLPIVFAPAAAHPALLVSNFLSRAVVLWTMFVWIVLAARTRVPLALALAAHAPPAAAMDLTLPVLAPAPPRPPVCLAPPLPAAAVVNICKAPAPIRPIHHAPPAPCAPPVNTKRRPACPLPIESAALAPRVARLHSSI